MPGEGQRVTARPVSGTVTSLRPTGWTETLDRPSSTQWAPHLPTWPCTATPPLCLPRLPGAGRGAGTGGAGGPGDAAPTRVQLKRRPQWGGGGGLASPESPGLGEPSPSTPFLPTRDPRIQSAQTGPHQGPGDPPPGAGPGDSSRGSEAASAGPPPGSTRDRLPRGPFVHGYLGTVL